MLNREERPEFSFEPVQDADGWSFAARLGGGTTLPSRPLDGLYASAAGTQWLGGEGDNFRWQTHITAKAGGFLIETTLNADAPVEICPAMILWLKKLDNMDDRQAHTWRQTILRAPTTNQQGLGGNDLPACYLYDHATRTETICYFPPDQFAWAPFRFYDFSIREVLVYRPEGRYGVGLVPNAPTTTFQLPPGEHRFAWWFTQYHRETVPTLWEALRRLIEVVAPLLDPQPTPIAAAISWDEMAKHTLDDLQSPNCWVEIDGQAGLRAYVRGSSALKRDEARGFELMTQLDVLFPLLQWRDATKSIAADDVIERLRGTLPLFARPAWDYVANNFPPHAGDSYMDTWYFLENALIKLPWVAYLTEDDALKRLFFTALGGARRLAHNTNYLIPLFADAADWSPRNSVLNVSVGGLYALGCVLAHQLRDSDDPVDYLSEASTALLTMHRLPPSQLTHEPQQLSFAAAAANYLGRANFAPQHDWRAIAGDFLHCVLRMGYWGKDAAVPFYDPRGMFQACASLSYPAYKENVESILPWAELLADKIEPAPLLAAFVNLQRRHNYAFFDPYMPEHLRRGPCSYIPYEDLATAEFPHTAKLGKELYGAGEVFWSALLFDALASVDDPDILCLCLDIPCAELRHIPSQRRCLLYNPTSLERTVSTNDGRKLVLPPGILYTTMRG